MAVLLLCTSDTHNNIKIFIANQLNREFRDAQWRGMPLPILWIAEYFTLDGENIRWNRGYREAGFYTHGLLWSAFGLWLIVNFLFLYSPRIGCYMWGLTGVILLTSVIMYTGIIYKWPELKIPFRDGDLELNYGWSFWLIAASGMFCIISFLALFVLDWRWPLLFMSLFDLTNEDCLLLEEDSQENAPLTLAPQRPRSVQKSRSQHSQIKPMYSVEDVTIENTSTCTLSGRTSQLTSSAVEMEVFVAKSSEDSI
ncbi:dual oxidase maturation factor 1-like [Corticium candelabrum]|uniref:dual oxidase maturation factor 1-like n=1 Tax=Corticium candelabrum TaxID=121492 RepID=UPI002E25ADA3|nr:dual oxidase maturation factor 1-like [Corticium candelabrum]